MALRIAAPLSSGRPKGRLSLPTLGVQAEFSLTQIWDHPRHGREFFEEVIRENIDWGRPETVQLIFGRKMRKSTVAGCRCRTRIVTEGVIPSLHVYYKNTHLKLCLQFEGFRNRQLRPLLAQTLGLEESAISSGRVSYELRRLRLHGLIERIQGTHRYRLTSEGLRTVVFYQRTYARIIRPGFSVIPSTSCRQDLPMARAFHKLQLEIDA